MCEEETENQIKKVKRARPVYGALFYTYTFCAPPPRDVMYSRVCGKGGSAERGQESNCNCHFYFHFSTPASFPYNARARLIPPRSFAFSAVFLPPAFDFNSHKVEIARARVSSSIYAAAGVAYKRDDRGRKIKVVEGAAHSFFYRDPPTLPEFMMQSGESARTSR